MKTKIMGAILALSALAVTAASAAPISTTEALESVTDALASGKTVGLASLSVTGFFLGLALIKRGLNAAKR